MVDAPWRLTGATAEFYMDGGPSELADIAIWKQPAPGAEPGDLVVEVRDLPIEWKQVGEGSGYPILSVKVRGIDVSLPPGNYYFSMRLVVQGGHGVWAWLCTTGNGKLQGNTGWWIWYCNPQRWDRIWPYFSKPLRAHLSTSDAAFTLYGERP